MIVSKQNFHGSLLKSFRCNFRIIYRNSFKPEAGIPFPLYYISKQERIYMLRNLLRQELLNRIEEEPDVDIALILTDWELYVRTLITEVGDEVLSSQI